MNEHDDKHFTPQKLFSSMTFHKHFKTKHLFIDVNASGDFNIQLTIDLFWCTFYIYVMFASFNHYS